MKRMKKRVKFGCCVMAALLVLGAVPVWAQGGAELYMKAGEFKEKDRMVDIGCMLKNGENINNGKVRIYYDAEKITLQESKAGEIFSDAMLEINDCLTGNKEEGELVGAFGAAQNIPAEGGMLDLKFQLKDGVEEGDKINFEIKPEKLAGDNGEVTATAKEAVYVVGKGIEEVKNEDKEEEKTEESKTEDKKNPGTPKKGASGSTKKAGKVKTGDESRPFVYLLGAGCAIAAAGGIIVWKKNSKKSKEN